MTAWHDFDFVDSGNVNNSPPFEFPTFDVDQLNDTVLLPEGLLWDAVPSNRVETQ
jgi:hypothetical protein